MPLHGAGCACHEARGQAPQAPDRNPRRPFAVTDLGATLIEDGPISVGPFVGYVYYHDHLNAYGCSQTAGNPNICRTVAPSLLSISEDIDWNAMRLGLEGKWKPDWHGLEIDLNAAGSPLASITGQDDHWLRLNTPAADGFAAPQLFSGSATVLQFDALASIPLTTNIHFGVGGRYWAFYSRGNSLFSVFGSTQHMERTDFSTRRYGVVAQISSAF